MKNTKAIKLNKDFKRLYYRGKSVAGGNIVVYALKNKKGSNRLGLTCSKAVGKAVRRNRAKRLMRESYRLCEDSIRQGYDFIIVARSRIVQAKCKTVKNELEYILRKMGLLLENEKSADFDD